MKGMQIMSIIDRILGPRDRDAEQEKNPADHGRNSRLDILEAARERGALSIRDMTGEIAVGLLVKRDDTTPQPPLTLDNPVVREGHVALSKTEEPIRY